MHSENANGNKEVIYYDDSVSMLERTAFKLMPIIREVNERMIKFKHNLKH